MCGWVGEWVDGWVHGAGCTGAWVLLSAWKAGGYEEVVADPDAKAAAKSRTPCHCSPASSFDSYEAILTGMIAMPVFSAAWHHAATAIDGCSCMMYFDFACLLACLLAFQVVSNSSYGPNICNTR